ARARARTGRRRTARAWRALTAARVRRGAAGRMRRAARRRPFPRPRSARRRGAPSRLDPGSAGRGPSRARAAPDRAAPVGGAGAPRRCRGSLASPPAHAAAAAGPARRPLASLAHGERPATERLAVEGADRRLGLGIGGQLDEGEAARPAGLPVGDDLHLFDLAPLLLEEGAQLRLVALVGQVAYIQSLSHSNSRTNEDAEDDPPPFPGISAAL